MPLYDFCCPACGAEFEDVRPVEDAGGPPCPACGVVCQRLVSAVHLKTNPFPLAGHKDKVRLLPPSARAGLNKPAGCGGCGGGSCGS